MMRRIVFSALTVFAMTAATLLGVEAAVRVLGVAPRLEDHIGDLLPDSVLMYRHAPHSVARGRSSSDEFDFEYRHNSLGFRDRERPLEKPAGTFRVVTLGDSFTYGQGADFDATWPSRLEALLNETLPEGERADVLRLGLRRFYPGTSRAVLEHVGLQFAPDLVIVAVVPNDVVDTHLGADAVFVDEHGFLRRKSGAELGRVGTWLFLHSHAMRIVLRRITLMRQQAVSDVQWDDVYRDGGVHEDDWRTREADLDSIAALSRSRGAAVMVAVLPMKGPWTAASAYPERRLAGWASGRGIPVVGLLDSTRARAARGDTLYWPKDGHPSPAGHDFIARQLLNTVTEVYRRDRP